MENESHEQRVERLAANAARHRAQLTDPESWLNPAKIGGYLRQQYDASDEELEAVIAMITVAPIWSRGEIEQGSAMIQALAMIRNGSL